MVENVRRAGYDPEACLKRLSERPPGMTNQGDLRAVLPAARLRRQSRRHNAA